jgi:polyphosphate glucokinase
VNIRTGEFVGERIRIPTPQPSVPREVVGVMETVVTRLIEALIAGDHGLSESELQQLPVGVGIPAATRDGTVLTAANIDQAWIGFQAEKELGLAINRTVAIGNDADVAGLAELRFGAGRGQNGTIFVLTIGTGMGTALFIDGHLVPNTELGHIEIRGRDAEEKVAESARDRFGMSWKEWGTGFNEYLRQLERLFWPNLFILGGGASKRADNYMQYITVKTPVVIATTKNNAGIIGAGLVAHERRGRVSVSMAGEPFS